MNAIISQKKSRENAWLWLVKIVLGLFILFVLGIHYVVNHLAAPGGLLTYNEVMNYYSNPIIPMMEFLFLLFAVAHSLIGMRSICLDLNLPVRLQNILDKVLIAAGFVATGYGTWLLIILAGRAIGK
jgi:succinate dehydrogenase hydrophobic anchor subunit